MTKLTKTFSLFIFALLFVAGTIGLTAAQSAEAAPIFPAGCSSGLGYSLTTGLPCNGTATATTMVAGCINAIGYSLTTGAPCSGASEAISFLAGCTSIYGYSTISGAPCNGTAVASIAAGTGTGPVVILDPTIPGLPTTGAGGLAPANITILFALGLAALGGVTYLSRRHKVN